MSNCRQHDCTDALYCCRCGAPLTEPTDDNELSFEMRREISDPCQSRWRPQGVASLPPKNS